MAIDFAAEEAVDDLYAGEAGYLTNGEVAWSLDPVISWMYRTKAYTAPPGWRYETALPAGARLNPF